MKVPALSVRLRNDAPLEIRSAAEADAPEVLAFVRELSRESWRMLAHPPEVFARMTEAEEGAFLSRVAAHPHDFFLAAWLGGRVVGTTNLTVPSATFSRHCGELGLGVLASCRRLGIARALLQTLIEVAAATGVWNLTLRVRTFNEPAIELYESLDFRRVGILREVTKLPEGNVDEYVYQRVRPPAA